MAAVHEQQGKNRRRRTRQTDGRRSKMKVCAGCKTETRWLSVDGLCWNCTVNAAKEKVPLFVDLQDEEHGNQDNFPDATTGSVGNANAW